MSNRWRSGCVCLLLVLFSAAVAAQSTTGSIQGSIQDSQGGGIPGATVTIRNMDTQLRRTTVTNESGNYDVQLPPPGEYVISAELAGFQPQQRGGVRLTVNQAARIDFVLEVGTLQEAVLVTGAAPLIETVDSAVRQVIDAEKMEELPLNGRNFRTLALIVPGVQTEVRAVR